jgi:serine/threonine-protein phosphatase 2A regulatory subunit A
MSSTRMLNLNADQDSVRLLAVEACGPLARLLNKGESVQHVLPIVQKFAQVCRA